MSRLCSALYITITGWKVIIIFFLLPLLECEAFLLKSRPQAQAQAQARWAYATIYDYLYLYTLWAGGTVSKK
jgi:hypothetical protein